MKTNSTSRSAVFGPRVSIGFVFCSVGILLPFAGLTGSATNSIGSSLLVNGKSRIGAATQQPASNVALSPEANTYANTKLTYKIINTPQHTWCYDVFADGRLMTHQTPRQGGRPHHLEMPKTRTHSKEQLAPHVQSAANVDIRSKC